MLWLLTWCICWLPWFQIHVVCEITVERMKNGDIFLPSECVNCGDYGATCIDSIAGTGKCSVKKSCKNCKCHASAKLFYQNRTRQHHCVKDGKDDINDLKDKCQFYVSRLAHASVHQPWIQLDKTKKGSVQLGFLKHISLLLYPAGQNCRVTTKHYWNIVQWKKLDEKFFIAENKKKHVLKLTMSKTDLDGYLIKLGFQCEDEDDAKKKIASCTMFKFLGKRTYNVPIPFVIPTDTTQPKPRTTKSLKSRTTLSPRTTHVTGIPIVSPTNARTLIIIIIGVGATLVLVVCGIVAWCCYTRRKGHKSNNNKSRGGNQALLDDPNYQNPDEFPGRRATSINGSASNLTYLQPIDANIAFNGVRKRPHDPGYDYPSVNLNNLSQKSSSTHHDEDSKPIYAEVSDVIAPSSRNSTASSRGPHSVVSEPGYQPPVGVPEFEGDTGGVGKYSCLGNVGQESYQTLLNQPGKPPTPQYAEVVPESGQELSI